jgi:AcrR family transcriptional regulator
LKRPKPITLKPRKSPVQARSNASVEAILEATIQVLIALGKDQLTTTKVAVRAGVSVGTLYQYFPNKSALLQAALRRHLNDVAGVILRVCQDHRHAPLSEMAASLVTAFLEAKMRDVRVSAALYPVSADVDGGAIVREISQQSNVAIADMLRTAPERLNRDPQVVARVLQAAMVGISRNLLESESPESSVPAFRCELIFMASSYLEACSRRTAAAV